MRPLKQEHALMDVEQARYNMIEQQIRTWDVLDQRILDLVARVPREHFVPEQYQDIAFADLRIPLGDGHAMMEPKLEARILQVVDVEPGDRVLEIGTGSGYLTACLSDLADSVVSYEIDENLSKQAGYRLASEEHENISLRVGDAMGDLQLNEQFDVIVLTGSLPVMDKRFHELLKINGRLFMVVGEAPAMEALLITRVGDNEWSTESLFETELAPLMNTPVPSHFSL
jgi:protein-L-isoaspartate(D-aspartate) O-methyltransferase